MSRNNKWSHITLPPQTTIREALLNLDRSSMQIVLVADPQGRLLGTVTDGDVRRALLRGATLDSRVEILDGEGRLVDLIHDKKDGTQQWSNPVVLMLGGLGMRLRPLTQKVPKPMLTVGDKPILETILEHVVAQGFNRFFFCINYLGEMIRDHFGDGSRWGVRIEYVEERQRMGTAGALGLLERPPEQDFLVMNGDLLTKVDLGALLSFHREHGHQATVCVREYRQQVPYGVMEMKGTRITRLEEKPVSRHFVNAGIYALSPKTLQWIPEHRPYDMPQLLNELIMRRQTVGGFPLAEYWLDIGRLPDFEQAQADFEQHFSGIASGEKAYA